MLDIEAMLHLIDVMRIEFSQKGTVSTIHLWLRIRLDLNEQDNNRANRSLVSRFPNYHYNRYDYSVNSK